MHKPQETYAVRKFNQRINRCCSCSPAQNIDVEINSPNSFPSTTSQDKQMCNNCATVRTEVRQNHVNRLMEGVPWERVNALKNDIMKIIDAYTKGMPKLYNPECPLQGYPGFRNPASSHPAQDYTGFNHPYKQYAPALEQNQDFVAPGNLRPQWPGHMHVSNPPNQYMTGNYARKHEPDRDDSSSSHTLLSL